MMLKEKILSVLGQAYPDLSQLEDNYFLIGASGLKLSGVEIPSTQDIDILTSPKSVDKLRNSWIKRLRINYQPEGTTLFRSNFARFSFDVMDIEAMGGLEIRKYNAWSPVIITDYFVYEENGLCIKIPTIEEQKRILILFGRDKDKAKLKLTAAFQAAVLSK